MRRPEGAPTCTDAAKDCTLWMPLRIVHFQREVSLGQLRHAKEAKLVVTSGTRLFLERRLLDTLLLQLVGGILGARRHQEHIISVGHRKTDIFRNLRVGRNLQQQLLANARIALLAKGAALAQQRTRDGNLIAVFQTHSRLAFATALRRHKEAELGLAHSTLGLALFKALDLGVRKGVLMIERGAQIAIDDHFQLCPLMPRLLLVLRRARVLERRIELHHILGQTLDAQHDGLLVAQRLQLIAAAAKRAIRRVTIGAKALRTQNGKGGGAVCTTSPPLSREATDPPAIALEEEELLLRPMTDAVTTSRSVETSIGSSAALLGVALTMCVELVFGLVAAVAEARSIGEPF